MTKARRSRLAVLALRVVTILGRFLLVLSLARFLDPGDVGQYGLLAVTMTFLVYPLGLDFYTFSTREILASNGTRIGGYVRSHIALISRLYLVGFVVAGVLLALGLVSWSVLLAVALVLPFEHGALELERLLVSVHDQTGATAVLLIRQGAWPIALVFIMWKVDGARSLATVVLAWSLGAALACAFGIVRVAPHVRAGFNEPTDWGWVADGVRIALPLLFATLALRALFTLDRFLVGAFSDSETLGAYSFFMSLASVMSALSASLVSQYQYPRLVVAWTRGDSSEIRRGTRDALLQTVALAVSATICLALGLPTVAQWTGEEVYARRLDLAVWCVAAVIAFNLALVPHFSLYAMRLDRANTATTVMGVVVFVVVSASIGTDVGVPAGILVGCAAMSVGKWWALSVGLARSERSLAASI